MKTLTIHQPWAWAIAQGHKSIENRSWYTAYRGPLLIHAGRSKKSIEDGLNYLDRLGFTVPDLGELAFGSIIAIARLSGCVGIDEVEEQAFAEGPLCWMLKDVRAVEPIPYTGSQGLFDVPEEIVDRLRLLDGSRVIGIEPSYPGWKPGALPLS